MHATDIDKRRQSDIHLRNFNVCLGKLTIAAEISSFIRGFHVYRDVWTPVLHEELSLRCEVNNPVSGEAVAVIKDMDIVVGHVPANLAPILRGFLSRASDSGKVIVTGGQVNRGAGLGLEIPCIYRLYGGERYVQRLELLVHDLKNKKLV